jgi:hypothetical protein
MIVTLASKIVGDTIGGGFDDIDENTAGFGFLENLADEAFRIIAPFRRFDEGVLFLEFFDEGSKPSVRGIKRELAFSLRPFDQDFLAICALVEREPGNRCRRSGQSLAARNNQEKAEDERVDSDEEHEVPPSLVWVRSPSR